MKAKALPYTSVNTGSNLVKLVRRQNGNIFLWLDNPIGVELTPQQAEELSQSLTQPTK